MVGWSANTLSESAESVWCGIGMVAYWVDRVLLAWWILWWLLFWERKLEEFFVWLKCFKALL